jgi:hypothetical protein
MRTVCEKPEVKSDRGGTDLSFIYLMFRERVVWRGWKSTYAIKALSIAELWDHYISASHGQEIPFLGLGIIRSHGI